MSRTHNTPSGGSEIVTEIANEQPAILGYLLFITSLFSSNFALFFCALVKAEGRIIIQCTKIV